MSVYIQFMSVSQKTQLFRL